MMFYVHQKMKSKIVKIAFAALAAVGVMLMTAALAYDSTSYVAQDALIAQWDAIDNTLEGGVRSHVADATKWCDLTGGGADFDLTGYFGTQLDSWTDTTLKAKNLYNIPCAKDCSDYVTIEVCLKSKNATQATFNSGDGLKKVVMTYSAHRIQFWASATPASGKIYVHSDDDLVQAAAIYAEDAIAGVTSSETDPAVLVSGSVATQNGSDNWGSNTSGTCLGRGLNSYPFAGEYCAIRLYNRKLTEAELAFNAQIDNLRFFEKASPNCLFVESSPERIGTPTPDYGRSTFTGGETQTFRAPATVL